MTPEELHAQLSTVSIFAGLSSSQVGELSAVGKVRTLEVGEILLREGEASDSVCLLLSGVLEVTKAGHALDTLRSGAILGEIGLLLDHPRSASIRVLERATCYVLSRAAFHSLLDSGSAGARRVLLAISETLARRQIATNERLVELLDRARRVDDSELMARLRAAVLHNEL